MKNFKRKTLFKKIINHVAIILLTVNLTSCIYGNDDDPIIVGRNNTYKGSVIDTNGNPLSGKTVVLKSSYNQPIAEFITDENGNFEGQGDLYNTGLQVEIKNEENFLNFTDNFVTYSFNYTEFPSNEILQFPPLIYTPISHFSVDITNNTGANYEAKFEYLIGACVKDFDETIEIYSLCYGEETRNFSLGSTMGTFRRSVFAVRGSTVSVTLTNDINTITETFLIDEVNQVESIVFE
jgi:hypothetical protein